MQWTFTIDNLPAVAADVLRVIGSKGVVALAGSMGAGKTTFVHALCDVMGVRSIVGSPTFSIINEYDSPNGPVYHIDCYRLRDEQEAIDAGVEDCLFSGEWCFVEWPEKIPHLFPAKTTRISLVEGDDQKRVLTLYE